MSTWSSDEPGISTMCEPRANGSASFPSWQYAVLRIVPVRNCRNTDNVRECSLRRVRDERDEVGLEAGMYVNITGSERLFEPLRGVDLRRPSFAGQSDRTRAPRACLPAGDTD